jgi:hypothetical protein
MCVADETHISPTSGIITCRDSRGKLTTLPLLQLFIALCPQIYAVASLWTVIPIVSQHSYVKFIHKSPFLRHRILYSTCTLTPSYVSYN